MPGGRPSSFKQEIADIICSRLEKGESLRAICRDNDMPAKQTVNRWLDKNLEFRAQYARARSLHADSLFEECLEIADRHYSSHEEIAAANMQINTRKWMVAKMRPKKYGDALKLSGDEDNPLRIKQELDGAEFEKLLQEALAHAGSRGEADSKDGSGGSQD